MFNYNCLFCTWKSDALFCGLTLKEPPLNEVEFMEDTPSARFRVEIVMDGPAKWIFKAKASIVFRALKTEIKIILETEYRKKPYLCSACSPHHKMILLLLTVFLSPICVFTRRLLDYKLCISWKQKLLTDRNCLTTYHWSWNNFPTILRSVLCHVSKDFFSSQTLCLCHAQQKKKYLCT